MWIKTFYGKTDAWKSSGSRVYQPCRIGVLSHIEPGSEAVETFKKGDYKKMKKLIAFMTSINLAKKRIIFAFSLILVGAAQMALAYTAPATGDFSYELYDLIVTNILDGPIGFVAGVGAMGGGAYILTQNKLLPGFLTLGGGVLLMNAENMVTSLGAVF